MKINERIKDLRGRAGLSQTKLAKLSGVTQAQISKIENGKAQDIAFFTIAKILNALGYRLVVTFLNEEEGGSDEFRLWEILLLAWSLVYFGAHFVAYLIR